MNKDNKQIFGPDFLCIGQQKTGTCSLYDQLNAHKDVWMPPVKELHFFDRGLNYDALYRRLNTMAKRMVEGKDVSQFDLEFCRRALLTPPARVNQNRAWKLRHKRKNTTNTLLFHKLDKKTMKFYGNLFAMKPEGTITGDVTPAYGHLPDENIQVIAETFKDLKIILNIRNPVDRVWSVMRANVRRMGLDETAVFTPEYARECVSENVQIRARSFPSKIYSAWARHFSEDVFLVSAFKDLCTDPLEFRRTVAGFLGIDADDQAFNIEAGHDKKAIYKKQVMPEAVRDELNEAFKDEISECKRLFGDMVADW